LLVVPCNTSGEDLIRGADPSGLSGVLART
jgi:hypothetical protein